jgi:hypothetical protein
MKFGHGSREPTGNPGLGNGIAGHRALPLRWRTEAVTNSKIAVRIGAGAHSRYISRDIAARANPGAQTMLGTDNNAEN